MRVIFGTDAIKHPLTGIGRYTFELAKELQKKPRAIRTFIFAREKSISSTPYSQS